ncbi:MAG: Gldg family protein [Roseibacillus sp.]|nr:Gldg family protein [Roseibacillus sp.]
MKEQPNTLEEQNPPPKKGRRRSGSEGRMMMLQLFLCLTILLSVNYFAGNRQTVWDLSQNKDFTLSNQTRNLLQSSSFRARKNPVKIIAAVRRNSAHYPRISSMLHAYERLSQGTIRVQLIDYVRDSDAAIAIADKYDTAFVDDTIIIDALPSLTQSIKAETAERTEEEMQKAHIRFIAVQDMLVFSSDQRRGRRVIGYRDEDQITASLRRALEGAPRRMYFLADKSQIAGSEEDAPWTFLSRTFASLNIEIAPFRISGLDRIPDDAAGIALVAPRFDLNAQEMDVLREYWKRPKAALLVVMDPTRKEQPPNIRAFLREHGVTPRAVRLSTAKGSQRAFDIPATFTNAAAVGDLGNASTMFEGATSSLELRENAEDLELRQILPLALIAANESVTAQPLDGTAPLPGPHYLAASVSRGNERNEQTAESTSRMIIVANKDFLRPRSRQKEHIDFLRNTSNWLIGREELSGIGPKPIRYYKLLLSSQKVSFVNKLNLFFAPGLFLLISLSIWNARRS